MYKRQNTCRNLPDRVRLNASGICSAYNERKKVPQTLLSLPAKRARVTLPSLTARNDARNKNVLRTPAIRTQILGLCVYVCAYKPKDPASAIPLDGPEEETRSEGLLRMLNVPTPSLQITFDVDQFLLCEYVFLMRSWRAGVCCA